MQLSPRPLKKAASASWKNASMNYTSRQDSASSGRKPLLAYLIEEIFRFFFSDGPGEGLSDLEFTSWIP